MIPFVPWRVAIGGESDEADLRFHRGDLEPFVMGSASSGGGWRLEIVRISRQLRKSGHSRTFSRLHSWQSLQKPVSGAPRAGITHFDKTFWRAPLDSEVFIKVVPFINLLDLCLILVQFAI